LAFILRLYHDARSSECQSLCTEICTYVSEALNPRGLCFPLQRSHKLSSHSRLANSTTHSTKGFYSVYADHNDVILIHGYRNPRERARVCVYIYIYIYIYICVCVCVCILTYSLHGAESFLSN